MEKYRYELHASRKNDDLIVDRYEQFYDDQGEVVAESKPHTLCVHPGIIDPGWPWHIRAIVNARHVPTVVDKHQTETLYQIAKQERDEAIAAKEAAEQARDKAMAAYAKAQESGEAEDIEQAKALRDEAKAVRDKAVTEMEQAIAARDAAMEARDAARQAHEDFIAAEG